MIVKNSERVLDGLFRTHFYLCLLVYMIALVASAYFGDGVPSGAVVGAVLIPTVALLLQSSLLRAYRMGLQNGQLAASPKTEPHTNPEPIQPS